MPLFKSFFQSIYKLFKRKIKKKKAVMRKAVKKKTVKKKTAQKLTIKRNIKKKTAKNKVKKTVKRISKNTEKTTKKKVTPKGFDGKKKLKKASKKISQKKGIILKGDHVLVGEVTHYFPKIQVAVIKVLAAKLSVGDEILLKGKTGEVIQKITSMQVESVDVKFARKGQLIGIKAQQTVKVGDKVLKLR